MVQEIRPDFDISELVRAKGLLQRVRLHRLNRSVYRVGIAVYRRKRQPPFKYSRIFREIILVFYG